MKEVRIACFFLFFLHLVIVFTATSASVRPKDLLGIAPQDETFYKAATIKCRDGSKKFTKSELNDDFCDCADGTDEPGTSACPGGKFHCRNAGHTPVSIYSSRVNDGICDCCDGSDEYDGKIICTNSCWEAGKVARDRLKKKIKIYEEGITLRKMDVEQSKNAYAKDETELSKLKKEEYVLKGLVEQLKERKEQVEKAEEKERLQKEKEEEKKREVEKEEEKKREVEKEENKEAEKPLDDKIGVLDDSPKDDGTEMIDNSIPEVQTNYDHGNEIYHYNDDTTEQDDQGDEEKQSTIPHKSDLITDIKVEDESENSNSLSREELGRIVGSRWTGKKSEPEKEENLEDTLKEEENDEYKDNNNGYDTELEDEHHKYDDDEHHKYDDDEHEDHAEDIEDEDEDDHVDSTTPYKYESDSDDSSDYSDISSTSNPTWLEKIQTTVRKIVQAVNLFQTPIDKSEAEHISKEYEESNAKLTKMQSKISSLTEKLKKDFGPEKEFYSFYGRCLEIKQNKYIYKICPYKKANQEEGHSTTRLGSWGKFEDSYRVMHFSNGDKCWNGPDRSLKVRLRCGLKDEVTDVGEPSRCEYEALLSTPAVCVEAKLKELQDKLNTMNKEQPMTHDEL